MREYGTHLAVNQCCTIEFAAGTRDRGNDTRRRWHSDVRLQEGDLELIQGLLVDLRVGTFETLDAAPEPCARAGDPGL